MKVPLSQFTKRKKIKLVDFYFCRFSSLFSELRKKYIYVNYKLSRKSSQACSKLVRLQASSPPQYKILRFEKLSFIIKKFDGNNNIIVDLLPPLPCNPITSYRLVKSFKMIRLFPSSQQKPAELSICPQTMIFLHLSGSSSYCCHLIYFSSNHNLREPA